MKAVIQRVSSASVTINGAVKGEISKGFMILLGVMVDDTLEQVDLLVKKIFNMRIFEDENEKMNLSLSQVEGELLVISQFTLGADCSHGNRPSFINAARPEVAIPLYEDFVSKLQELLGKPVQTGEFGADMKVSLCNDGPVTIIIDTEDLKKKK